MTTPAPAQECRLAQSQQPWKPAGAWLGAQERLSWVLLPPGLGSTGQV